MAHDEHDDAERALSRRALLRRGVLLGASLGALGPTGALLRDAAAAGASAPGAPGGAPTPAGAPVVSSALSQSARNLLALLGLRYPIVQAPTSGPAGPELAIAVANAGALGALALTRATPEAAYQLVQQVKAATQGAFFVNYVLHSDPPSFSRALEAGPTAVQFSFGMPTAERIRQVRAAGAKLGVQVTGTGSARAALDLGADYLVCQGMEAGGHVQGMRPLNETLDEVLREVGRVRPGVPVLASGGIANGRHIRGVMARGAAGAVLGTRFVATQESRAHPDYKRALVDARDGQDTSLTMCLSKGWSNVPHRILSANPTLAMWEAAGCPPEGRRPGEKDVLGRTPDAAPVERYMIHPPLRGTTGKVLEMGTFAGTGVGEVRDVPRAGDLVRRLWHEYESTRG